MNETKWECNHCGNEMEHLEHRKFDNEKVYCCDCLEEIAGEYNYQKYCD
jgi:late competence protein required for DNA uptake (superfamily II DNA/RNA helicase)